MDLLKVMPNIPSRYTSTKRHCTALAYVPVEGSEGSGLPLLPPPPGQSFTSSPEALGSGCGVVDPDTTTLASLVLGPR